MNTGVHDAVNLTWKLGGVLRGWYDESILDTYEEERKPEAQRVIEMDKTISSLITGRVPEGLGKPGAHPFEVLYQFTASTIQFTLGLGVYYKPNLLNHQANVGMISPGWRAPDVLLRRPGSRCPVRLFQVTKNHGKFHILVFSGHPASTCDQLLNLRRYLDSDDSFTRTLPRIFNFLTIIPGDASQADEYLGVDRFGEALFDADQSASTKYGFSAGEGGIAILRPDGMLGCAVQLGSGAEIGAYFQRFVKRLEKPQDSDVNGASVNDVEYGAKKEIEFDTETSPLPTVDKVAAAA
jgi:phenol 2-monooxygenase (NADPH)